MLFWVQVALFKCLGELSCKLIAFGANFGVNCLWFFHDKVT